MLDKHNKFVYTYVSDENFAWICGLSIMSLLSHNPGAEIYLLKTGFSEKSEKQMNEIAEKYHGTIHMLEIKESHRMDILNLRKWSSIVFVRLFLNEYLPEDIDRVLYLDCDTMIRGSLKDLSQMDLKGAVIAGSQDCLSSTYRRNIGLKPNDPYINAGVVLFDMVRIREMPMRKLISDFLSTHYYSNSYGDQDVINAIFKGHILVLPMQYNVLSVNYYWNYRELKLLRRPSRFYSENEFRTGIRDPLIVHFTGHVWCRRPWYLDSNHPLTDEFQKYLKESPWADHVLLKTKKSSKTVLFNVLFHLPRRIFLTLHGILHAFVFPWYKGILQKIKGHKMKEQFFN